LLDDVRLGGARSHSFLKRIQIDDHQVNCWNFELGCLSQVTLIFSSVEDASKDLWVKGFYSTSKDGRIAREVFYRDDFSALLLDKRLSATCRVDLHAMLLQQSNDR